MLVLELKAPRFRVFYISFFSILFFSFRLNCSLCAHPERDELILFGGEYFNGQKVMYTSFSSSLSPPSPHFPVIYMGLI